MKKYDIVVVQLSQTKGAEKKGVRPAVVIQNNRTNASHINTAVIIPFTTTDRQVYLTIPVKKSKENGLAQDSTLELAQVRVVDLTRILKTLGVLDQKYRFELRQQLMDFLDIDDEFE
ncbi:MAG: type II toxin-antitoxin system PemK/MazF family toxin [Candidatus Vogelbacteria bacterium]|nr:type II toxin-antitoxin system PemK/MazF family toxin [Candidatus Vogelbacteria bacterium]